MKSSDAQRGTGTQVTPPRLLLIGALGVIGFLYLLFLASEIHAMVVAWSDTHAVMSATQQLPEGDFARFWYVGKRMALQRMAEFGLPITPSASFQSIFHLDILATRGHPSYAWLYPPTMNLLGIMFSFLPLPLGFFAWGIGTLAAAAWMLRRAGLGWSPILAGLFSAASIQNFTGGQNGALTGGVLVAALLMVETRPWFGGWVAGILCIKPQMALALPVILLRRHRCKALAACAGAIAVWVVLSVIVEGWVAWVWFFTVGEPSSVRVLTTPFSQIYLVAGATVFFMARSFGIDLAASYALQALSAAISLLLLIALWRKPKADAVARMAMTVCLAALMTPYGFNYDLVGFSIAMAVMYFRVPDRRKAIYGLLWLAAGYSDVITTRLGHIVTPLAMALGAFMVWVEMRAEAMPAGSGVRPRVRSLASGV